jgi:ANTAR domain
MCAAAGWLGPAREHRVTFWAWDTGSGPSTFGLVVVTRDWGGPDQQILRERALARWLTSAPAAALPPPRRQQVTIEVREHNGREHAAVTALDGEVLALYRVTRGAARLRLVESAPGTAEPPTALSRSLALLANSSATRAQSQALRARSAALLGRARSARTAASAVAVRSHALRNGYVRPRDGQILPVSALTRMKAQLATMPVIEQAKGILVARTGCDPDQAFDQLRGASQRANVPVRVLAARLVEQSISRDAPLT